MADLGVFTDKRSRWITFDEDSEVCVKYISREVLGVIWVRASRTAARKNMKIEDAFNVELGRRAVGGWRKIDDHEHPGLTVGGEPFPYSPNNSDFLMVKSLDFSKFINEVCINFRLFSGEESAA